MTRLRTQGATKGEWANSYPSSRPGWRTRLATPLASRARRRRYETFARATGLRPDDRILDIGCGTLGLRVLDGEHEIVGLDRVDQPAWAGGRIGFIRGDALAIPVADREFDVAFCNSLIEHIAPGDRPKLAAEIRRVAERYFVQTPNRFFPIEPHVLLPLFQFLPLRWQRRLWRFGVAGGEYEQTLLLDRKELSRLFPDARIVRERVGPLTKSLMAVGPATAAAGPAHAG
ncbi:MAG: class I SAM-dependent methyltransferase, partial [Actinomycetota bacterium]|nr:class I SAM-dependent methyltransferase [Actinomycetota bacterium]